MGDLSRRELLLLGLAAASGLAFAEESGSVDLHQQLLELAQRFEKERRARFDAVMTPEALASLQGSLRETFLRLIGGLPEASGVPAVKQTGRIDADDYFIEKLAVESLPGYFVPALLYVPRKIDGKVPAVLSPCGHSSNGKAYDSYQVLHINLAKRGFVVLAYDPVGQGERSQFWDSKRKTSRFGLGCPEHAVIGNALELLGMNLARYRIWDGMRCIDYLTTLPQVDASKIGCVGNSGGGTLTAYITALDPRVSAAAICCYITTLPRRMGNRIQKDPTSDPEQDLFGFVSEGVDHAGLLALCAPRPTLIGAATLDFFPIEGTRESFAEARRLYEVANAGDRVAMVETPAPHGFNPPMREAVYAWFERWLSGRDVPSAPLEFDVQPRPTSEILVCEDGQANLSMGSRPLLPLALEEFRKAPKPPKRSLREILRVNLDKADPLVTEIDPGLADRSLVVCVNGNDAPDWREAEGLLLALRKAGHAVAVVDPRGVGRRRAKFSSARGHGDTDPISSVEANIAYNAFLVGQTVIGLRVADVLAAVRTLVRQGKPKQVILCGGHDAALVAVFAAAVEPSITAVAVEDLLLSYQPLFAVEGYAINAASIPPGLLRDFGGIADVLGVIQPRRVLLAASAGDEFPAASPTTQVSKTRFSATPSLLTDWLKG